MNRVQTYRSTVVGARPTGIVYPGELYTNYPEIQLGVIDVANQPVDLLAVRFFSPASSYAIGDHVIQAGQFYRAITAVTPAAFNPAQWELGGGGVTIADIAPAGPGVGDLWWDSLSGQLFIWYNDGNTSQWVIANNTSETGGPFLPLLGGTLTGPLILSGNAAAALQAVPLQQVLPLAGGTMTGPVVLSANAAAALQAVPLQQLTAGLADHLPLAGGVLTGTLVGTDIYASGSMAVYGAAGTSREIFGRTVAVDRWAIALGNQVAESGTNAGSDFGIQNYADDGTYLDTPLYIGRATSEATFSVAIVNGPSDRTLKENIEPIENALDKVLALQGVSFNLIATPDKREIGLIAQDVAPVVPEIIQQFKVVSPTMTMDEVPSKMALDYPKLTALLIEAVKTLAAENSALDTRLVALEARR